MLIQALYNVVDSIFVARYSADAMTAISLVNPVQMLMISIGIGSAVGVNSLIARRLGAKRSEEADKYIIYENLKPELRVLRSAVDNTWEVIAVDKDEQRILGYPVPDRKSLGKCKFSADGNYMTDAYGRSYRVIEKFC